MTNPSFTMIRLFLAPALIGAALTSQAMAQSTPATGPYVEGGIGQVQAKKADANIDTLNARAGYQINPFFAVEGDASIGTGKGKGVGGDYKLTNKVGAFAVGTLPVSERISLIGRVGVSDTQLKRPAGVTGVENGTSKDMGVGAKVKITEGLSVRGDYTHSEFNGSHGRSDQLGLNLVKSF